MTGDFQDAVDYFQKANNLNERAITHRQMTIAYYYLDDYENCVNSFNGAFQLDKNIFADRDAVIVASRSYASIGKYEVSKKFLAILAKYRPEMKDDEEFYRASMFLRGEMKKAGLIN